MIKFKTLIIFFFIMAGCKNSDKEIHSALRDFDTSLDTIIKGEVFDYPKYFIFQGDTLRNNPKRIDEVCYQIIEDDSIKIDANSHIYTFENNQLVTEESESVLGNKYIYKYIYFRDSIDYKLVDDLKKKNKDTIIVDRLMKYNKEGYVVKDVMGTGEFIEFDNSKQQWKRTDDRILRVFSYPTDKDYRIVFSRSYYSDRYNTDSLRNTEVRQFKESLHYDRSEYSFKRDVYSNWVVKKKEGLYPVVYYRKITY